MSGMKIKNSIFEEEKEEFPWDENALKTFKKLIKDEGITCLMDDIFLLGFLRAKKFDIQTSLQILKNYYNMRIDYPQFFKNLLPSKLEHILNMNIVHFLPKPDQNGRYIYIFRFGNWDPSVGNATDLLRAIMIVVDFQLNFHRTQEKKIVCIIDAGGLTLSHFYHFSPRITNSLVKLLTRDCLPLRFKAAHYVNLNIIMKALLIVLIPLLSEKYKKKIHLHSNMESLHEFISPDCLPIEYGGKLPSFDPTDANNMLKSNEELFQRNEEYVKLYEEERNKNFNKGTLKCNRDYEDEKNKQFLERVDEMFECHSDDPEAFVSCLKNDSEFDIPIPIPF